MRILWKPGVVAKTCSQELVFNTGKTYIVRLSQKVKITNKNKHNLQPLFGCWQDGLGWVQGAPATVSSITWQWDSIFPYCHNTLQCPVVTNNCPFSISSFLPLLSLSFLHLILSTKTKVRVLRGWGRGVSYSLIAVKSNLGCICIRTSNGTTLLA